MAGGGRIHLVNHHISLIVSPPILNFVSHILQYFTQSIPFILPLGRRTTIHYCTHFILIRSEKGLIEELLRYDGAGVRIVKIQLGKVTAIASAHLNLRFRIGSMDNHIINMPLLVLNLDTCF